MPGPSVPIRLPLDVEELADRRLTMGVDVDGVLFDQVPHIIQGFRDLHGVDLDPVDDWHWDLSRHPEIHAADLGEEEVWQVFQQIEVDASIHQTGLLDPHVLEVLERWRERGHEVHIVTSRRPVARAVTQRFLDENGIPHDELAMGVWPKIGYDVLVDDLPPNVRAAAEDGSAALLFDQPYNRGFGTDGNPRRVGNWREVAQVLGLGP